MCRIQSLVDEFADPVTKLRDSVDRNAVEFGPPPKGALNPPADSERGRRREYVAARYGRELSDKTRDKPPDEIPNRKRCSKFQFFHSPPNLLDAGALATCLERVDYIALDFFN